MALTRESELAKYPRVYARNPRYRMNARRHGMAFSVLKGTPYRGSYLDVACGRGEMMQAAKRLRFGVVRGTEIVPALCVKGVSLAPAWDLPFEDSSFDVVSMLDTIEHILPGDDYLACAELQRVAKHVVIISAANHASVHEGWDLHVNKRPHEEWDRLFREWFNGDVRWLKEKAAKQTEIWRIDLR